MLAKSPEVLLFDEELLPVLIQEEADACGRERGASLERVVDDGGECLNSFDNSVGPQVRERGRAQRLGFGVLFGLLLALSAQTATQLCARDFGYQPVLGPSVGRVYPPWANAVWASWWGARCSAAFQSAADAGLLFAAVGTIALVACKLALARANPYLHGSAGWASAEDAIPTSDNATT